MSGCTSDRSVHVPVGTLSLTLAGLATAGIAVLATQVIGGTGGGAPPDGGSVIASTAAIEVGGSSSSGGVAGGVQFSSGFEVGDNGCSTTLNGNGYIGGGGTGLPQNCDWRASAAALATFIQPHIGNEDPNTGAQQLRFQYDPNQATGNPDLPADTNSRNWAFSDPDLAADPNGVQHLSLWVKMGSPGGTNNLIIQPQAPSQELLSTVFILNANGTISVGDDNGDCTDEFFAITVVPGVTWVADEYRRVDICIDNPNDRIRYFYGGEFIYSTGAGEGGVGGPLGCGVFAGTAIEHVLIRYEANAQDGTIVDVDDVLIEVDNCPAPSGACCIDTGNCQFIDEDACATAGGIYLGHGVQCDIPICDATLACEGTTGDCFTPNASPGCDQADPGAFPLPSPSCCALVCSQGDPFDLCCQEGFGWQAICVQFANLNCPKVNCTQPEQNCQQMDLNDTVGPAQSAAGVAQVADNFTPASNGSVSSVCWYGTYFAGGTIPTDSFKITYYDCVDGVPGSVVAGPYTQPGSLTVTKLNTNLTLSGPDDPIFEYKGTHAATPQLTAGTPYFIEIIDTVGVVDPPQTWFWQTSNDISSDGTSFQKLDGEPYARHFQYGEDMAFCLNIELGDTTDLCPFPPPEPCVLDVSGATLVEPETCGQDPDFDLGCSGIGTGQPPNPFWNIGNVISLDPSNPTVIAGQAWADNNTRDVDWIRFVANSTPDITGDGDGFIFVCLQALSELPIGAVVGTIPAQASCDGAATGVFSAVGFECQSTLGVATQIPVSVGTNDLGVIIVRTYDGVEVFNGYPCAPACPWDCQPTPDGVVGINDFLELLAQWTMVGTSCDQANPGDGVGINDFLALLAAWGNCPTATTYGHDYLLNVSLVDDPALCFPEPQ